MARVQLLGHQCERCGHEWFPRVSSQEPRVCPRCKSPYWNRPRLAKPSAGLAKKPGQHKPIKAVAASDRFGKLVLDSKAVRSFCAKHRITAEAVAALKMADRHFPKPSRLSLTLEQDPESDRQWLAVDVVTTADPLQALDCYGRFIQEWSKMENANARQLIHLTFGEA